MDDLIRSLVKAFENWRVGIIILVIATVCGFSFWTQITELIDLSVTDRRITVINRLLDLSARMQQEQATDNLQLAFIQTQRELVRPQPITSNTNMPPPPPAHALRYTLGFAPWLLMIILSFFATEKRILIIGGSLVCCGIVWLLLRIIPSMNSWVGESLIGLGTGIGSLIITIAPTYGKRSNK